jgi:hypothetical protein
MTLCLLLTQTGSWRGYTAYDARPRRIRREVYDAYTRQRADAGAVVASERKKCTEKPKFKVNEQCGAI